MTPNLPERIDRYEIQAHVARGSSGTIYRAVDLPTGETVALKVLVARNRDDRVAVGRFLREARAARDLQHPHILQIHQVGQWSGGYFLAMEWVEGQNLLERLESDGPLPIELVLRVACEIGSALDHAHAHRVLHRDVKPANIILQRSGGASKLVDFGFAKRVDHGSEAQLTQSGMAMGTPLYISPEQVADAKHVGFTSDIYSFGATLYHMLTGRPPYVGRGIGEIIQAMMNQTLEPPVSLRPETPTALSRLITRMLAKEPQFRFASMRQLLPLLERGRAVLRGN